MKPNLKDLKKHLEGIPEKRLPVGKYAWLQEWQETKELVEAFEKQLQERIKQAKKYEQCSASKTEICCFEEIIGEEK